MFTGAGQVAAALAPQAANPLCTARAPPGSMRRFQRFKETPWRSRCTRPACRSSCACSATSTAGSTRPRPMPRRRSSSPSVYLGARLAPDMLPLHAADPDRLRHRQVLRRAPGRQSKAPKFEDNETTLAELRAADQEDDRLRAVGAGGADRRQRRHARSRCRAAPGRSLMKGEMYLKHFALPNFFFHVTTAYALLRHNGVEPGQERLPRRADHGRLRPGSRGAAACRDRISCGRGAGSAGRARPADRPPGPGRGGRPPG